MGLDFKSIRCVYVSSCRAAKARVGKCWCVCLVIYVNMKRKNKIHKELLVELGWVQREKVEFLGNVV